VFANVTSHTANVVGRLTRQRDLLQRMRRFSQRPTQVGEPDCLDAKAWLEVAAVAYTFALMRANPT
jgi:hypothetical protein